MYICDLTRASGAGRAMCLNTRGLVRSVIRRIVPPLPAESSPSNTMHTLAPVALTHSCMATSSPCRRHISLSYSFLFILRLRPEAASPSATAAVCPFTADPLPAFLCLLDFFPIGPIPSPEVSAHVNLRDRTPVPGCLRSEPPTHGAISHHPRWVVSPGKGGGRPPLACAGPKGVIARVGCHGEREGRLCRSPAPE